MKEKFAEAFVNLWKIKSILTLAATFVFVVLSLRGDIAPAQFLTIFTTIVGFYFGSQKIKENEGEIIVPDDYEEPDKLTPASGFQIDTDEYHED